MNGPRQMLLMVLLLCAAAQSLAAELHALIRDQHGKPLPDAVVLATPSAPVKAAHPRTTINAVDQVDKQFVSYVTAVYVGSKVIFPNSDHVWHQVYSFSKARRFELRLYAGADAPPVTFDTPGVVVLGC